MVEEWWKSGIGMGVDRSNPKYILHEEYLASFYVGLTRWGIGGTGWPEMGDGVRGGIAGMGCAGA